MSEFHFDTEEADRACAFFERYLTHTKGVWAQGTNGKPLPLKLDEWQREHIIRPLFGWKRADGSRKYRTCYIRIPRKQGKTTISAGIALYLLFADREPGAEIYSAAADRDQASLCFDIARQMVSNNRALSERAKVYRRSIANPSANGFYKVLSADAFRQHGLNAHGVIFDELHAQPNRELWDVLTTSTGARRQPLVVGITTAGVYDPESICWQIDEYACKVRDGVIEDPTFLPVIYGAGAEDDWTAEDTWKKANPGYGVSIHKEYFEGEVRKAKESISYLNTFKRLHLNIWTQTDVAWLDMDQWNACDGPVEPADGADCWAGLDLASKIDLNALVLVFKTEEGRFLLKPYFWMPEKAARQRERRDRIPYGAWVKEGLIEQTGGDVVDYEFIERRIVEVSAKYNLKQVNYDPWNATQTALRLKDQHGINMVEFRQGYASLNEPSKELERLVISGQVAHAGNPVLKWMASNVAVQSDAAGNIKPVKPEPSSPKRIDGIVAAIMGLSGATTQPDEFFAVSVI